MTITEIFDQAKHLSVQERKELAKLLIDTLDMPPDSQPDEPQQHWGQSLNRLLDELGPIEMLYPEIEDPVEWVKHLRSEQRKHRLGNWGDDE